jgi:type II secretory pathway pseudopilin PulG
MNAQKQTGFTIIEVSLVLGISSLLLMLMMVGITLAVQRQRFSDSVNGTQSFLQQQFNFTQNVLNDRSTGSCGDPTNPGDTATADPSDRGASGCVVLGKLLEIAVATGDDESTVNSYDVVGTDVDTTVAPYKDYSDLELMRAIHPTVIKQTATDTSYIVPWGAQIANLKDADKVGGNSSVVRFVALLRSPRSGIIHVYKMDTAAPFNVPFSSSADTLRQLSSSSVDTRLQEIANDSLKMCVSSVDLANFRAMLEIIPSGSQDGIISHFDDQAKDDYPCA